jgi:uncharacterized protein (TIGR02996 family)
MTPTPALEQAFLDDIVAHPDDPALWLILADWLDEQEDPRAELVRLTWGLHHERDHADFATRQARLQKLLADGLPPLAPRREVDGFDFAWIPPGSFEIGSPTTEARRFENEVQHPVTLTRGFWMSIYPVTQGQWFEVMADNPAEFSPSGRYAERVATIDSATRLRFPVENVSWNDIQPVLKQLGGKFRLPTEAEWEFACRAGTTTTFHFGPSLNGTQACCNGTEPYGGRKKGPFLQRPAPVGSYPPNARGLHDMHGNVYEVCQDTYREDYEKLKPVDPFWERKKQHRRVLRGGCWQDGPWGCRAAFRYGVGRDERVGYNGFRVALAE